MSAAGRTGPYEPDTVRAGGALGLRGGTLHHLNPATPIFSRNWR